jgi:hypothetical protein
MKLPDGETGVWMGKKKKKIENKRKKEKKN